LQEAQEHLEYGQIDEAREVLEAAILKDPQRPELHQDLLEIYRSTRAKEAFQSMRERIDTDSNPAAAAWQALADLFVTET
jgi:Tfp pilus assembly protein PilF